MKGHEQLRLTRTCGYASLCKNRQSRIRMFANIRHAKERYLCKLNGGNKDGEGGREGETHKPV